MTTSAGTRLAPPAFLLNEEVHRRHMAMWMREAHQGHLGNVGTLTLSAGVASTAFTDFRVGPNSFIGLVPLTANAAAEIGAGTLYISARSNESFTITHANNAQVDRTFSYCILG